MLDVADFPTAPEALDTEFLSSVLGQDVRSVTWQPIGVDTGFAGGRLVRLKIAYLSPNSSGPTALVAKFAPADAERRQRFASTNQSEILFFNRFATASSLPAPRCFFAGFAETSGASLLLIEDLGHLDVTRYFHGCGAEEGARVIDALAQWHAAFRESSELDGFSASDCLRRFDLGDVFRAYPDCQRRLLPDHPLETRLRALCDFLADAPEAVFKLLRRPGPRTLVHRDLHLDNLFLDADTGPVFFDWQFAGVGCGVHDVSYFLISSFERDIRRRAEMRLLRNYCHALSAHGVRDVDFDICAREYVTGVVGKLCMTMIATVLFDNASRQKTAWRAVDQHRLAAFCEDHNVTPALLQTRVMAPAG